MFQKILAVAVFTFMVMKPHSGYEHGKHGEHHGADGMGHDEVNMPGLQGRDTTDEESADLAVMFRNFESITRTVSNLPNGITTVTHTDDSAVMNALVSHVSGMINLV